MDFEEPLRNNPRYKFLKKLNQGRCTLIHLLRDAEALATRCAAQNRIPLSLSLRAHMPAGAFGFVVLARRLEDGSLCAVKFMQRGSRITKYVSREFINHR